MRWFFLILLVLNIGLFAWFQQEQEMRDRVSSRAELSGVDVAPIRLLSEMPIQLRKRPQADGAASKPSVQVSEKQKDSGSQCYLISGFSDQAEARRLLLDKLSGVNQGRVLSVTATQIEYWVYVRSPADLQRREEVRKQLQDSGYEVSVARQGELKGQLSLGLYRRAELARALYESLKDRSYDAAVFELPREVQEYAIELGAEKDGRVLIASEQNLIDEALASNSLLKSEKKLCQGVASRSARE